MKISIDIPIEDYWEVYDKLEGIAASEGLYDDRIKSEKAITLGMALKVIQAVKDTMPYSIICPFYENDCEAKDCCECESKDI